jgi:hypothetical protein
MELTKNNRPGEIAGKEGEDKLNSSRANGSYNNTKVVTFYMSTHQEPLQSVVLDSRRVPENKITQVTVSSSLPKPVVEEE